MARYVFDIESDGLLDTITKVHCINMVDRDTGKVLRFTDHACYQELDGRYGRVLTPRTGDIKGALHILQHADEVAGQHIVGYDIPALKIVYPNWPGPSGRVLDTKVMSQVIYPTLKEVDILRARKGRLPADFLKRGLAGRHSLEAWGLRLGVEKKADFKPKTFGHTWATMPFTKTMDDYCAQDVVATEYLLKHFESKNYSAQALEIEHEVARIISWQERVGIPFDSEAAAKLACELQIKRIELEEAARNAFGPFHLRAEVKTFVPKRDHKSLGYVAGAGLTKVKLIDFNPGSRDHIANRLMLVRGWEPTEFTPTGKPKVDETILAELPWPEAKVIAEYMLIAKRLGQVGEGDQAWMKAVKKDGRIYGRVNQMGTVTGRMAHFGPNLAQVPRVGNPYGRECRALFTAEPGRVLVGCDADALELRMLAHFMARFDEGAYVEVVLNGRKDDGTDIHTRNQTAIGLLSRDTAKTWFYAYIYGAGNYKLGTIIMSEWDAEKLERFYAAFAAGKPRHAAIVRLGKRSRDKFMASLPALAQLTDAVKASATRKGWLKGLDGREITVRSNHAALNTLLQGGGAIVMKLALVLMFREFNARGLDVRPLLNIHDEVQLSTPPEVADDVGAIAADAIRRAGLDFGLRCPLGGDYAVGSNWSETH